MGLKPNRTNKLTFHTSNFELKADSERFPNGTVEGLAARFGNIDRQGETILPGAFARTVATFKAGKLSIPLMDNHRVFDGTGSVIGKVFDLSETDEGLAFKAFFGSSKLAQETRAAIREGLLDKLSIGFSVVQDRVRKTGVRELLELVLREISVVVFPANEEAVIAAVKGAASGPLNGYQQLMSVCQQINCEAAASKERRRKQAATARHYSNLAARLAGLAQVNERLDAVIERL